MADKKPTVAMGMLQKAKSVDDRSGSYHDTIKRNIQRDVLDALQTKKEELEDRIFTLSDFSLETDVNKGTSAVSREEAERRFKEIIDAEYELKLIDLELQAKQQSFNKYFVANEVPQ